MSDATPLRILGMASQAGTGLLTAAEIVHLRELVEPLRVSFPWYAVLENAGFGPEIVERFLATLDASAQATARFYTETLDLRAALDAGAQARQPDAGERANGYSYSSPRATSCRGTSLSQRRRRRRGEPSRGTDP